MDGVVEDVTGVVVLGSSSLSMSIPASGQRLGPSLNF